MKFNRDSSRLTSTGASWHCPRRSANRPGSQRMARHKSGDFLQSAPAGRHAADGDRPRSGGSMELRRRDSHSDDFASLPARTLASSPPANGTVRSLFTNVFMDAAATVLLKPGEADRVVAGHPWIYQ